ncbi:hypothetical protein V8F20_010491 [Naviculisporaceae sp. PSN 640]
MSSSRSSARARIPIPDRVRDITVVQQIVNVNIGSYKPTFAPASTPSQPALPPSGNPSLRTIGYSTGQKPMCRNGSGCREPLCHLKESHPLADICKGGKNCGIKGCPLFHPKSVHCEIGPSCPMVGCDKAHPWPRVQEVAAPRGKPLSIPNNSLTKRNYQDEEKCADGYKCPGGYNGKCPLSHPWRAPCRAFQQGHCPKGAACTFYHGAATGASSSSKGKASAYAQAQAQAQAGRW